MYIWRYKFFYKKPVYKKFSTRTSEDYETFVATKKPVSVDKKLLSYNCYSNFSFVRSFRNFINKLIWLSINFSRHYTIC